MEIREDEKKTGMTSTAFWGALASVGVTVLWILYATVRMHSSYDLSSFLFFSYIYLIWPLISLLLCWIPRKKCNLAGRAILVLYGLVFLLMVGWLTLLGCPHSGSADDGLVILLAGIIVDIAVLALFILYVLIRLILAAVNRKSDSENSLEE